MIDFAGLVFEVNDAFGEPMTFIPSTGEARFPITGVWHEASRLLNAADGMEYVSEVPTVSVTITLVSTVIGRRPQQEDQIVVPRTGNAYIVREARYDGLGNAWLLLNFAGDANADPNAV